MTTITHDPDEGCAGCPFRRCDYEGWLAVFCGATRKSIDVGGIEPATAPPWCPLRSGPVVVRARDEDDLLRDLETVAFDAANASAVWSNASTNASGAAFSLEALAAAHDAIRALTATPTVRSIDAPSTIIAELRRRLPVEESLTTAAVGAFARLDVVPLHVDNDLPAHTVRLRWSDGREELLRL